MKKFMKVNLEIHMNLYRNRLFRNLLRNISIILNLLFKKTRKDNTQLDFPQICFSFSLSNLLPN